MNTTTETKKGRKATHKGECQVCGRTQKLPNGRLSLHGYTTRCGFFEGVCGGADHLPLEQDKSLIEGAIKRAEERAEAIKAEQSVLRAPVAPGTTKTWANIYISYKGALFMKPGYYETQVEVYAKENQNREGDHKWLTFHYPVQPGQQEAANERHRELCANSFPRKTSIEEVVADGNEHHAQYLEKTVIEIANYIAWQRGRIKNWAPKPLKPIK